MHSQPSSVTYLTARELSDRIKYKPTVINNMLKCRRRLNIDPPCRLNFDPGMVLPAVMMPAVDNCSSYLLSSART